MDDEIEAAIVELAHNDPVVRLKAAEKLGNLQVIAAVPGLCEILQEDMVRYFTRNVAGQPQEAYVLFGLLGTVKDGAERLRRQAADSLVKIGAPALPALIKMLYQIEPLPPVPSELAYALGKIGPPALPMLLAALSDERADVCRRAADAIGYVGDVSACPALLDILSGDQEVVYTDDQKAARYCAARALVRLGHTGGIRTLLQCCCDEGVQWWRTGLEVTTAEVIALVRQLDVPAVPILIAALEAHWCETLAARILLKIGNSEVLPRKILIEPALSIEEKIDLLTRLRKVRYRGHYYNGEVIARYDLPDVLTLCLTIMQEDKDDIADAARLIVNRLTLLRGAQFDVTTAAEELLRPIEPGACQTDPETMLRAVEQPPSLPEALPEPQSYWKKIARRLFKG